MAYTSSGAKAFAIAHQMQLRAQLENHPQHEQHVRDQIDYVNSVADHLLQQIPEIVDQRVRAIVREEIDKALSEPKVVLKVDEKSAHFAEKRIRSIFQSLFH